MKKWERPRKIKVRKITTIILIHHYYLSSFPDDERKRELERGSQRRKAAQARNVCFYLSSSPLLIKSQPEIEVERRDQINLLNLVFMKHFQSKRGIDLNREGELRAHETSYDPIERHSI